MAQGISQHCKDLGTLILDLGWLYTLEDLTSKQISQLLLSFKNLHFLKQLSFNMLNSIEEEIKVHLPFENYQSLKKLSLYFDLISFDSSIQLKSLEQLTLSLSVCCKVSDNQFKQLSENMIPHLKELKKLTLIFAQTQRITDRSVEALSTSIGVNLKKLRKLALEFSDCQKISQDSLRYVGVGICEKLKDLKTFRIVFKDGIVLNSLGMILLSKYITHNLRNLKDLTFDFLIYPGIPIDIINEIVNDFAKNLKTLKKLKVNFGKGDDIPLKQRIRRKLSYIQKLDLC